MTYLHKIKNKAISRLSWMPALAVSFARYLIAGGMGFIIDYAVLILCSELLHLHYLIASAMGFTCGLIFVYNASNKWCFSKRKLKNKQALEFITFSIIGIIGLMLTMLFMWIFTDKLEFHVIISKLLTTGLVILWNFGARKLILY